MVKMAETRKDVPPGTMTPDRAQVIVDLFRAIHPSAADEIGHFVDGIVHGFGDDVTDPGGLAQDAGAPVSIRAAQAAVEFVMAAMLTASR
jgi:hypothetical protein